MSVNNNEMNTQIAILIRKAASETDFFTPEDLGFIDNNDKVVEMLAQVALNTQRLIPHGGTEMLARIANKLSQVEAIRDKIIPTLAENFTHGMRFNMHQITLIRDNPDISKALANIALDPTTKFADTAVLSDVKAIQDAIIDQLAAHISTGESFEVHQRALMDANRHLKKAVAKLAVKPGTAKAIVDALCNDPTILPTIIDNLNEQIVNQVAFTPEEKALIRTNPAIKTAIVATVANLSVAEKTTATQLNPDLAEVLLPKPLSYKELMEDDKIRMLVDHASTGKPFAQEHFDVLYADLNNLSEKLASIALDPNAGIPLANTLSQERAIKNKMVSKLVEQASTGTPFNPHQIELMKANPDIADMLATYTLDNANPAGNPVHFHFGSGDTSTTPSSTTLKPDTGSPKAGPKK